MTHTKLSPAFPGRFTGADLVKYAQMSKNDLLPVSAVDHGKLLPKDHQILLLLRRTKHHAFPSYLLLSFRPIRNT